MTIDWLNFLDGSHAFDWLRPFDPPRDMTPAAGGAWVWVLLLFLGAQLALWIVLSLRWHAQDPQRFPRPFIYMLFLTPVACLVQESVGEWWGGIWYAWDTPLVAFTMQERHIPWWLVLLWFACVPLGSVVGYWLMVTGAPVRAFVLAAVALGVAEMAAETLACNTGLMSYYGYYAELFGVPPTQILTNGFMYIWIGLALAYLIPRLQKSTWGSWRWLLIVPTIITAYVAAGLFAIPLFCVGAWLHRYPVVNWGCMLLGLVLTVGSSIALLYTPWAKRFREDAEQAPRNNEAPITGESSLA